MARERWDGTLPNGTVTKNQAKYIREWRAFAAPLEKALGMKCCAFDPGLQFLRPDGNSGVSFDRDVVKKLNAALETK